MSIANVASLVFWENSSAQAGGFVVIGHTAPLEATSSEDSLCIYPLFSTPERQFVWVQQLCGGAALAVNMVRENVQYRLSLYLESRAREDRAGSCNALSLDRVPACFQYMVLGREWILVHEESCKFVPGGVFVPLPHSSNLCTTLQFCCWQSQCAA